MAMNDKSSMNDKSIQKITKEEFFGPEDDRKRVFIIQIDLPMSVRHFTIDKDGEMKGRDSWFILPVWKDSELQYRVKIPFFNANISTEMAAGSKRKWSHYHHIVDTTFNDEQKTVEYIKNMLDMTRQEFWEDENIEVAFVLPSKPHNSEFAMWRGEREELLKKLPGMLAQCSTMRISETFETEEIFGM